MIKYYHLDILQCDPFYMIGIDMKWNKFADFAANNLALAPILEEQIGPVTLDTNVFPTLKDWIEKQVQYVAVRPWSSLNPERKDSPRIRQVVYFHIENIDSIGGRARYPQDDETIADVMAVATAWHGEYWAKQPDNPLVFDAVVCKHLGQSENGYRTEALEIFIAPPEFQLA